MINYLQIISNFILILYYNRSILFSENTRFFHNCIHNITFKFTLIIIITYIFFYKKNTSNHNPYNNIYYYDLLISDSIYRSIMYRYVE